MVVETVRGAATDVDIPLRQQRWYLSLIAWSNGGTSPSALPDWQVLSPSGCRAIRESANCEACAALSEGSALPPTSISSETA
jgi:hypothetical protein